MFDALNLRPLLLATFAAAPLVLAGCGGVPSGQAELPPTPVRGGGAIHAVAVSNEGIPRALSVDYAAAGLSGLRTTEAEVAGDGSLVIVGVFRDGRVDDSLDLETLSISVPLSELPNRAGSLDVVVDASTVQFLLEGTAGSEARVIAPETVTGQIHLRYDAPPRPGIVLRGDFSVALHTPAGSLLRLEGEFDVPVLGS